MSTISKNNPKQTHAQEEAEALIARARTRAKARRMQKAQQLSARLKPQVDGSYLIQRFNLGERIQHFILIFSFTLLGFTGLMQTFSGWMPIAWVVNNLLGGIDSLRIIHHIAAITFAVQTVLHGLEVLNTWFVKREWGSMMPQWSDLTGLIGMLKYNLGLAKARPHFDRFSIEEKVEYWALWWGALCMGVTGIIQWYPALITSLVPGNVVPMARLIHMLEAILAVTAIAIWHMYHTVIKERNLSIFTGFMTVHEMEEAHPVEYRRILAARDFLENLKNTPATPEPVSTEATVQPEAEVILIQDEISRPSNELVEAQ
jgi:formate dehydrogenase subunit gamma